MKFAEESSLEPEPDINIIPLIDVLFFIIIFFVMSTSFTQNGGVDVNLPTASTKRSETKVAEMVVTIGRGGELAIQNAKASKEQLRATLAQSAGQIPRPVVVIQADRETQHGLVVEVMDLVRQSGFEQLAVATLPPQ